MNIYDVAYRNKGRQLEIYHRSVMADSLEAAIELINEEMPMESHEEYVSVTEITRNVMLPKGKQSKKRR